MRLWAVRCLAPLRILWLTGLHTTLTLLPLTVMHLCIPPTPTVSPWARSLTMMLLVLAAALVIRCVAVAVAATTSTV